MLRQLASLFCALLLTGCATMTTNVPEEHKGPVSVIRDSSRSLSGSKAEMYFVTMIDGQRILDSSANTRSANYGRGMSLTPAVIERKVLPQASVFSIMGRTQYGAPVQAMFGTVHEVSGEVKFTPEAGKRYIVRGELSDAYSAVWIEEEVERTVMGQKIERGTPGKPR